jgi:N-acetyltransferase
MRTYSRNVRRTWDGDDFRVAKRPRVESSDNNSKVTNENDDGLERAIRATSVAISSSPSRKNSTIFSHESFDDEDTVTPPSSPPPRLSPPAVKARKPTFSFLKKRKHDAISRDESEPLGEVINSSVRSSAPPAKKQQTLHQMQLDLGGPTRKTCPECGMEYVPANEEDASLHRMFHNMNSEGVELGKTFNKSAMKWVYEVAHIEGSVVVVDRKISPPARKVVQKVLGTVNKELSAVDIDDAALWSQRTLDEKELGAEIKQSDTEKRNDHRTDRYKVFLHVKDGKCVGLCLAERITKAHRVVGQKQKDNDTGDGPATAKSSSISTEETTVPAVVGVSRIWTSKSFRRKGIANNLLECVMSQFIYGMEIEKDELAFSQPTESGCELARAWYGDDSGWLVYNET